MGYDDNFTCKYVFFTFTDQGQGDMEIDLGEAMERVPNMSIELIQAKVISVNTYDGLNVKMLGQGINYFGNDHTGSALGLLNISPGGNENNYQLEFGESPVLTIGTTRRIQVKLTDSYGTGISTTGGNLIFKLTYPKQPDQITATYAMEIQRGL